MKLYSMFFRPEERGLPYRSQREAAEDILAMIDAYLYQAFFFKEDMGEEAQLRGVVITPDEYLKALVSRMAKTKAILEEKGEVRSLMHRELEEIWTHLEERAEKGMEQGGEIRIWSLANIFSLSRLETFCFFLAAACDYDRKYERLFGYLQDNVAYKLPTEGLGVALFCMDRTEEEKESIELSKDGPLWHFLLRTEMRKPSESRMSRPMDLRDTVSSYLLEGRWFSGAMGRAANLLTTGKETQLEVKVWRLLRRAAEHGPPLEELAKDLAVAAVAAKANLCLLEYRDEPTDDQAPGEEARGVWELTELFEEYGLSVRPIFAAGMSRANHYFTEVRAVFSWEDLVLEKETKKLLRQICAQVRLKNLVKNQWGFQKKSPYGNGISALFYGAPGTGKTMAAQVVAGELGLKLYKVDLSSLLSKYIGETEKRLRVLFDEACGDRAVLFFDEADGLFSKRTNVDSSNDRYANMETGYLLQKFEEYEGITILATNYNSNIDDAFKRRIRFLVQFSFPDAPMRLQLWRNMLPDTAPLDEELALEEFASRFTLSGSGIREVMMNAAYLAADGGRGLQNQDIKEALKTHFAKYGRRLTKEELGEI